MVWEANFVFGYYSIHTIYLATEPNLPNLIYQTKSTIQNLYHGDQTKSIELNLPIPIYKTKSTKLNLPSKMFKM